VSALRRKTNFEDDPFDNWWKISVMLFYLFQAFGHSLMFSRRICKERMGKQKGQKEQKWQKLFVIFALFAFFASGNLCL